MNGTDTSRDIFILWKQSSWDLICHIKEWHRIKTEFVNKTYQYQISILNFYAPPHFRDKDQWWKSLVDCVNQKIIKKIIVRGDLNLILDANEK